MEFYSAIPEYAAMFGCTCDEFINVYALIAMSVLVVIGVAIGAFVDIGISLYHVIKGGASFIRCKAKK